METIQVQATIAADKQKVWDYYTLPEHITKWNFASDDWCCPTASNDLKVGGRYVARMEAKDGSFGFDFDATYTELHEGKSFRYVFGDRAASVEFSEHEGKTQVTMIFDPETVHPVELQKQGWQAILDNFKKYTETN
jgi:uncharacterized protein YndB with AHSA1/START domain